MFRDAQSVDPPVDPPVTEVHVASEPHDLVGLSVIGFNKISHENISGKRAAT